MRVLLQRVKSARVVIDSLAVGEIATGLLLLIGIGPKDDTALVKKLADKIVNLRIFDDANGKMNLSALDTEAEMLVVSQFTLYADWKSGRRPGFSGAAKPEHADPLINEWLRTLQQLGIKKVASGQFGANMQVELINDGPITIMLDEENPNV
ncbi:MAG: D-aminoacyl-tRNA deacylase [Pseudomonadota bacterium]|nr:D-aminoacyl-tRNA deacylase [Pseudomonadota bacterium]